MVKKGLFFSYDKQPNSFFKSCTIIICIFSVFCSSTIFPAVVSGGLALAVEKPVGKSCIANIEKSEKVKKIVTLGYIGACSKNQNAEGYKNPIATQQNQKTCGSLPGQTRLAGMVSPTLCLGVAANPVQAFSVLLNGVIFIMEHAGVIKTVLSGLAGIAIYIRSKFSRKPNVSPNCGSNNIQPVFPNDPNNKNNDKGKTRVVCNVPKKEAYDYLKSIGYEEYKDGALRLKRGHKGLGKDAQYLSWDHLHKEVEAFRNPKKHTGAVSPINWEFYKGPDKTKTLFKGKRTK